MEPQPSRITCRLVYIWPDLEGVTPTDRPNTPSTDFPDRRAITTYPLSPLAPSLLHAFPDT